MGESKETKESGEAKDVSVSLVSYCSNGTVCTRGRVQLLNI